MYFRLIEHARDGALGYLLGDLDEREAVVVDPPADQTDLVRALLDERDLRLRYILRTHIHHPDRADSAALCEITGAHTAVGEHAPPCSLSASRCKRLVHGETLVFGNELVRVLSTPGHTSGCVSYLWRDRLFCGDVFDVGSCVTGNQEADAGLLFDSLTRRILHLPDETLVFPAHGLHGRTVSTMSEQRKRLVQLSERSREAFVTEMAFKRLTRPKLDEPFTPTRDDG